MEDLQDSMQLLQLFEKDNFEIDIDVSAISHPQHTVYKYLNTEYILFTCRSVLLTLLPSPLHDVIHSTNVKSHTPRATAWLDGVRGLAALVVFFQHFSLAVKDSRSIVTCFGSPGADSLWQLPIVRLLYDGGPMVPIFYVTSGCALSLRPLACIRQRDLLGFGNTISSSTFRRAFRLFLPSAIISFLVMISVQVGIYSHPYNFISESVIEINRPLRLASFSSQLLDWLDWTMSRLLYAEEIFQPLPTRTESNYGFQLWTISTEFYASLALFITLTGLITLRTTVRQALVIILCGFAFYLKRWDIACFIAGICITELSIQRVRPSPTQDRRTRLPAYRPEKKAINCLPSLNQYVFVLVFITGLFLSSYPARLASNNVFFASLAGITPDMRFWESIGAILILLSASRHSFLRFLLSSSLSVYLGRISYGVYLTHVAFLNILGWRVVPWIWTWTGKDSWWVEQAGFVLGLIICVLLLLWVADLWTRAVDEPCVRLAKRFEKWAMETE